MSTEPTACPHPGRMPEVCDPSGVDGPWTAIRWLNHRLMAGKPPACSKGDRSITAVQQTRASWFALVQITHQRLLAPLADLRVRTRDTLWHLMNEKFARCIQSGLMPSIPVTWLVCSHWSRRMSFLSPPTKRRSAGRGFRPTSGPPTNRCRYVAPASWKRSLLSARSPTREAGTHCQ